MLASGKVQDTSDGIKDKKDNSVEEDPVLDVRDLEVLEEREEHGDLNERVSHKLRKARILEDRVDIVNMTNNDTLLPKQCIIREKTMINVSKVPVLDCSVR